MNSLSRSRMWPFVAIVLAGAAGTAVTAERTLTRIAAPAPFDERAAEAALERGNLAPAAQLPLLRSLAESALQRKDPERAIAWAQRYMRAGGAEADVRPLLVQAYYGKGDYANAARELQFELQAAERAGRAPGEDRLLLLKDCYAHLNDANALAWSLEKLATWYPRREYWSELLDRLQARPDFGQPLAMDVNRLRFLTGALAGAPAYLTLATQLQQAEYPAEALRVLDRGFATGVLGTGPDAARQRDLRKQVAEQAAQQQKLLAQPGAERAALASPDGNALLRLGHQYVTQGQPAKGLPLMERGVRKPVADQRPQYARLHLGISYLMAGQRAKAMEVFANVGGRHGAADLARVWGVYARNAS
jgi:hypothetical protein